MTNKGLRTPVAMTVAGSDSGGGAGIQADLKTFSALSVFGTSAITCLTAQNPGGVAGVVPTPRGFVRAQILSICSAFPVKAAKTGMLYSGDIIQETADTLKQQNIRWLIVDPVAAATSGSMLLQDNAVKVLLKSLLPAADAVTPNIPEAEMITGSPIESIDDQLDAARDIASSFKTACVLKGGHMPGSKVVDILFYRGKIYRSAGRRIAAAETHGTGCTLSSALTAYLARGATVPHAFSKACDFVRTALRKPLRAGKHNPLGIGR